MRMLLLRAERTEDGVASISVEPVSIKENGHELKQFCKLLDCWHIDIVTDTIGGKEFDLIADDDGLYDGKIPSYYISDDWVLFGNVLFCHADEEGKTTGLEEGDLVLLLEHVMTNIEKMNDFSRRRHVEFTKKQYRNGMRVELIEMRDTQAPPAGTKGWVSYVDDAGTVHVRWETGSTLGLVPGEDRFRILD